MKLEEAGEVRVRGYLFILGRSLRAFLREDLAADALKEVESHILERVEDAEAVPDAQRALERILDQLGTPLHVAQAYAAEMTVEEAVSTGRALAIARAIAQVAASTITGFLAALVLFVGYAVGVGFLIVAALKPILPGNVGLWVVDGVPRAFGALFPPPPGATVYGGYWVIPIAAGIGLGILVGTHRVTLAFLAWWRARRETWRAEGSLRRSAVGSRSA